MATPRGAAASVMPSTWPRRSRLARVRPRACGRGSSRREASPRSTSRRLPASGCSTWSGSTPRRSRRSKPSSEAAGAWCFSPVHGRRPRWSTARSIAAARDSSRCHWQGRSICCPMPPRGPLPRLTSSSRSTPSLRCSPASGIRCSTRCGSNGRWRWNAASSRRPPAACAGCSRCAPAVRS